MTILGRRGDSPDGRRPGLPEVPARKPRKRALLIGIQYEADRKDGLRDANPLKGPHTDVEGMRKLLIDLYSYAPEDIVVLVDKPDQVQPTHENIVREINRLVDGAVSGDHFFFHYAGHAKQITNKNNSEEDGMDECLIPCDGEDKIIMDNVLRRLLVDRLPIGCNLTAIFDSCHSATLLDLDHYRCNGVYVPWISKGTRRSDPCRNRVTRRGALVASTNSPNSSQDRYQVLTRRIFQTKRTSATSRKTSRDEILVSASNKKRRLTIRTRSLSPDEKWFHTPQSPIQRCFSPERIYPCAGDCPPMDLDRANVISISACDDYQLVWETEDMSMTKALIKILREDNHPNLRDLMTKINHELHRFSVQIQEWARVFRRDTVPEYNKRQIQLGRPPKVLSHPPDMDNFPAPQLSSHVPLRKDARWNP